MQPQKKQTQQQTKQVAPQNKQDTPNLQVKVQKKQQVVVVEPKKQTTQTIKPTQNQPKVQEPKKEPVEATKQASKEPSKQKVKTMKCVMLTAPKTLQVKQVPIPKPGPGEVLIKVMAAPINPSDLALYQGHYGHQKKFPTVMGFQGSGLVVENGGGVYGWGLVNKKVAFGAEKQGQGSYSQYVVAKSEECLPLADDTSFQQGAMCVINPLTALGMLDTLKQRKQKWVVITAAASALGRMMNRLYPKQGVQVINIVRRAQQVQILKSQGAKHIFNSSDENFEVEFKTFAQKVDARTCFQAIGGKFTGIVMRNMPKNSIITVYGCLSHQNLTDISVMDLLVYNKTINSFLLPHWLKTKNQITLLPTFYKVRSSITEGLKSNVSKKFQLQEANQAIKYYLEHMSQGKVLFQPWSQ